MAKEDNFDNTSDTAGEPIVITTELDDGGTISWTPSRHTQEHVQDAIAAGKGEEYVKELQDMLAEKVHEIEAGMCLANIINVTAQATSSGMEGDFIREIMAAALGFGMVDPQSSDLFGDEGFGAGYRPHSVNPRQN